jgi:hypothetical protein
MRWVRVLLNGSLWSIAGVLITVAIFYWQAQRGAFNLDISLEDEVNLVEVREAVPELQITYEHEDLLKTNKAIKLIRLRIQNRGETILQSYFDQSIPFRVIFPGSQVLDVKIEDTNSDYLKEHLLKFPQDDTNGTTNARNDFITFAPVIFERNKFALVKVYLLQEVAQPLQFRVEGKIANIDSLSVTRESKQAPQSTLTSFIEAFFVGYGGAIVGMLSIIGILLLVDRFLVRAKKNKLSDFLVKNPGLSAEEKKLLTTVIEGLSSTNERLFRACARNDGAIDLREFMTGIVKRYLRGGPLAYFLPVPPSLRRLALMTLPSEIFIIDAGIISLNPTHKDLLIRFAHEAGILS